MVCTDTQVRLLMKERKKGRTQLQAAVKANVKSRKTVARYEKLGKLPSELKEPRRWRTRLDPFAEEWGEISTMLAANPGLEAQAVLSWLQGQKPGQYTDGQVRTLQRRIGQWRALHVEQVASLAQVHKPGEVMETDGTWLTELGVTIGGEPFKHLLIHCVLPYSNWEWGYIAQSESVVAVREAVQRSVQKLGAAPAVHQTDNSTAATYQLKGQAKAESGEERAYHPLYLELLDYYGMKAQRTHVASPDENGDVEASNGTLKRALRQQLLLRGSRDFATAAAYTAFVEGVLEQRNRTRQKRLVEELAVMKPVTKPPLAAYRERRLRVSEGSLICVQTNHYSVPTSLIGRTITVRQYEWHLEIYYQQQLVERMPRLVGQHQDIINYRHLVGSLLRKPGGFRNYRYRPALFPQPVFQRCWEQLSAWHGERQGDLCYLRILHLAAQEMECEVAAALSLLLEAPERFNEKEVTELVQGQRHPTPLTVLPVWSVNLQRYDALLQGGLA
jgi:hypothetical protein